VFTETGVTRGQCELINVQTVSNQVYFFHRWGGRSL